MIKKLLKGCVAIAALLVGGAMFVTRDIAPSHPVLQASDLPPLIPTRVFYADPDAAWDYIISPDATYVVVHTSTLTGRRVVVREVASGKEIAELPLGAQFIRWHPTQMAVRFIFEGHDWEMDLKKTGRQDWTQISPQRLSGGWVKNEVATDPDMPVLTWGKVSTRSPAHMWRVSQDGLKVQRVAEGTENTRYWVFDEDLKPALRLDSLDTATERLSRKTPDGWEKLIDISLNDTFWPLTRVRADGTVLARSSRGRDKVALVAFDVESGKEQVLLKNPDTDIGQPISLSYEVTPDLIRLGPATLEYKALTKRGEVLLDILAQFAQPVSLGVTYPSVSGRYVTQVISPRSRSNIALLIDLEEESYVILGEDGLRQYADDLVPERAVTFTARDGVEIPAVLTLPKDTKGPVPFVVYVHGGPALHTELGYGHGTQFLVNRGYGVLSVNFRGSTGFGKAFQAKGFRQFGRAMQDDISDAAHWLVKQGLADADALAVMGVSYGGYAAAMAMTREPDLFEAAIVEFPMLDVEFQTRHYPGFWASGLDAWWRYFGKIDVAKDLEEMRAYSPINLVDQLHGPMIIIAGVRDQITAVQQVRDFEAKAKEHDKDVRVHYFAEAGHGVKHWRDRLRRARLLEDFLAQEIGGRSGGFEFAERAPAFID